MRWDDPFVKRSIETGKCEFCDNSNDPRTILEHLRDVHRPGDDGKKATSGTDLAGGSVSVRAHSRNKPRK